MHIFAKAVLIFLGVLGAYYAGLGAFILFNVSAVTTRWIELSNDADFKHDFEVFRLCIGGGAVAVSLLGLATAALAATTLSGRRTARNYWMALAVVAPLIHAPWFLYRVIATGRLPRAEAVLSVRVAAIRFALICVAYVLASILTRRSAGVFASVQPRE